jgi:hypothetical protein
VKHPFKLLVGETEIDYKANINSCGCAESSARAFSWDGGSRGRLGVSERFQMIMKQRGGDAHGDRGDGFVVVEKVGRFDLRGGVFVAGGRICAEPIPPLTLRATKP